MPSGANSSRRALMSLLIASATMCESAIASSAAANKADCLLGAMRIRDLPQRSVAVQACITRNEAEQIGWLEQFWAAGGDSFRGCPIKLAQFLSNDFFNAASFYSPGVIKGNPFFEGQERARVYMREARLRMGDRRVCDELQRDFGPGGQRLPGLIVH